MTVFFQLTFQEPEEKKRYYSIIVYALNTSAIATWRMHCQIHQLSMSHLNFGRDITLCLMKSTKAARSQIGEPQAPADVRHDGVRHFPGCSTQGSNAATRSSFLGEGKISFGGALTILLFSTIVALGGQIFVLGESPPWPPVVAIL